MRERQTDKQTDKQTDRQTDRQIDRQTDRQTGRQCSSIFFIHFSVLLHCAEDPIGFLMLLWLCRSFEGYGTNEVFLYSILFLYLS